MKITCLHGYFRIEETSPGVLSEFLSLYSLPVVLKGDHFTFQDLEEAPDFSLAGLPYLTGVATKTYAGRIWEIFEANEFIYNYDSGLIVPIESITQRVSISDVGGYFQCDGLILPGSLTDEGQRVRDYAAWYFGAGDFRFTEVGFV